jgi:hypothetical protein
LKCENFVEKFLSTEDQASAFITVKNYHKGLSQALHSSALNTDGWALKGPLGFGSSLVLNAVNYAFVGGTGILPLLDQISAFALHVCNVEGSSPTCFKGTGTYFGKYF